MFRRISAILTLSISLSAAAQSLEQEITVDHEVVPERNNVTRLEFTPSVNLPAITHKRLNYSNRPVNITVPGTISTLDPAAYADTIYTSPWRGYAAVGIMPLFNAGASAGYKFIDNDHTRLAGFFQYNGSVYRGHFPTSESERQYVRSHTATIDLSLHQAVGKKSFIDAGADFSAARYNMPHQRHLSPQIMRRAGIQAAWTSSVSDNTTYRIGASYSHFAFNNTILTENPDRGTFRPVHENIFGLNGFMRSELNDNSAVGIDAGLSVISNNRRTDADFSILAGQYIYTAHDGDYTHALLTFRPFYRFDIRAFRLDLGARVDFTFKSGKVFHIAPDVQATWKPAKILAVFAKAGGGEHQNTLRSLFGATPYAQTMMAYENSHIPFTFDLGATIGTWKGAFITIAGGYARANDWLMPVTDSQQATIFKAINMRGFHWRVEAGYTYNDIASLTVSYQGAQQGYNKGYYLWRDRAKSVLGAALKVTPIKPLDISIAYELRSGRAMLDCTPSTDPLMPDYAESYSLGRISNLSAGANYRLTDRWSAFIYGNNILCTKYRHIGLVPGQGINGLIGASYKF